MIPFKRTYLSFPNLRVKLGGRSRSSCGRDVKKGRLPKPIRIGARLYWIEEEVDSFLEARREAE